MATESRKDDGLVLCRSVEENIMLPSLYRRSKGGILDVKKEHEIADSASKRLSVKTSSLSTMANFLSGGNQQKAIVAREIDRSPHLLIAMQPTRGLDVGAIEYIHKQIIAARDEGKAVLLVSLEMDEVLDVSDRILVMYEGEIVGELDPKTTTAEEIGLYMAGAKREVR